jgi:putative lipoprotein
MYRNGLAALAALLLTACSSVARLDGTRWLTEFIDENGVIDNAQTTLEFTEPGRAAGRGGCNRYSAPVEISGSTIKFGDAVSTKMACVQALMDQENRFLAALRVVRSYRMKDQKLELLDETGKVRVSLSPLDSGN